jgi:3-hydroxymyristoyl/3-hydroxydecanoyl-(acyl carrier protein) dehydratase
VSRREPLSLGEERSAGRLVRSLRVPADLAFLEGHFPGRPVVAAVVQLRWVMDAAHALLGRAPEVVALEGLRFRDALRPGDACELSVEWTAARDALRFSLASGERAFAAGRLRLRAAVQP